MTAALSAATLNNLTSHPVFNAAMDGFMDGLKGSLSLIIIYELSYAIFTLGILKGRPHTKWIIDPRPFVYVGLTAAASIGMAVLATRNRC